MKASELINRLVKEISVYGDVDVICDCLDVTDVYHDNADEPYYGEGWIELELGDEKKYD